MAECVRDRANVYALAAAVCSHCGASGTLLRCSACRRTYYCNREHQRIHWPQHRTGCTQAALQPQPQVQQPQTSYDNFRFEDPRLLDVRWPHQVDPVVVAERHRDELELRSVEAGGNNIVMPNGNLSNGNDVVGVGGAAWDPVKYQHRVKELRQFLIRDMRDYGICVIDNFLGRDKGVAILNEVVGMHVTGQFKEGKLVSNRMAANAASATIRGDQIAWVDGTEDNCGQIGELIRLVDSIVLSCNGSLGRYNIYTRTKAMVACYPGAGAQYVKHVDNPSKDGRCITGIYYLNIGWNVETDGGLLRIFPESGNHVANIEPLFDRMLFFWSDRRNPHEVQPAFNKRYAITLWYLDKEEREAAIVRCGRQN